MRITPGSTTVEQTKPDGEWLIRAGSVGSTLEYLAGNDVAEFGARLARYGDDLQKAVVHARR